jgi:RNA polymerase sigma-70 factor (ECF subfamily)
VTPSDETLMAGVGRGDERAFEALYGRYRRRLYNFILRYGQDEALAEDLFQEAFLRLLQAAPRWRPQARLSTWLYRVTLNLCIDESRKRREAGLSDEAAEAIAGGEPGPQEALEAAETAAWLRARVAGLPEEQRAVLLLRVYEGLEEREVAEIVGCPVGTVKSRLYHALRKLRLEIGGSHR